MIVQLLFAGLFYLSPIADNIEGNYLDYLRTDKAIVETWNDQIDIVADIARRQGFCEVARGRQTLVVSYEHGSDLRFNLWKLGQDAAVDSIRPFPTTFIINHRGDLISGHRPTERQGTGGDPVQAPSPN